MDKMETHNFERYMIDLDHILDKVPKSINDLHSFLKFLHPNVTLNFTVDSKKKGENRKVKGIPKSARSMS